MSLTFEEAQMVVGEINLKREIERMQARLLEIRAALDEETNEADRLAGRNIKLKARVEQLETAIINAVHLLGAEDFECAKELLRKVVP